MSRAEPNESRRGGLAREIVRALGKQPLQVLRKLIIVDVRPGAREALSEPSVFGRRDPRSFLHYAPLGAGRKALLIL